MLSRTGPDHLWWGRWGPYNAGQQWGILHTMPWRRCVIYIYIYQSNFLDMEGQVVYCTIVYHHYDIIWCNMMWDDMDMDMYLYLYMYVYVCVSSCVLMCVSILGIFGHSKCRACARCRCRRPDNFFFPQSSTESSSAGSWPLQGPAAIFVMFTDGFLEIQHQKKGIFFHGDFSKV